ncbi:tryptophan 5-hydroxylase 1 isoform 2 [Mus musculus]|uniref:Tryptophan hydroxylase 1 n=1 Tax=Mus musculus TaxID=10090 RepID=Q3TZH2_MOUSE|nr:tryptophan 5-hydroxylase 1 isoform 2 [Mus musculus]BAE34236.1 unnamed protein product [Mus musculus]|eukprot:NP_001263301.1 tryptophan 5-hydroxylase 1 isoform 2 [Mus musculus]
MIEDNKENKENKDHSSERGRVTLIFSLENEVGGLIKVLKIFQENHVSLLHIESRKSKQRNSEFEIFVDCDISREQLNDIFPLLKSHATVLSVDSPDQLTAKEDVMETVPWFPKKISDLDFCANRVLLYGSELDADHPVNMFTKSRSANNLSQTED